MNRPVACWVIMLVPPLCEVLRSGRPGPRLGDFAPRPRQGVHEEVDRVSEPGLDREVDHADIEVGAPSASATFLVTIGSVYQGTVGNRWCSVWRLKL